MRRVALSVSVDALPPGDYIVRLGDVHGPALAAGDGVAYASHLPTRHFTRDELVRWLDEGHGLVVVEQTA